MIDEEWVNLPLLPARLDSGDVYCFELVRDSEFQVCRKSGASVWYFGEKKEHAVGA